jgi:hypothetical protein
MFEDMLMAVNSDPLQVFESDRMLVMMMCNVPNWWLVEVLDVVLTTDVAS